MVKLTRDVPVEPVTTSHTDKNSPSIRRKLDATCKTEFLSVAEHKATKGPVHVQVGYMGLSVCGKVEASNETVLGGNFVVESHSFGTRTFPARLVRKCSGLDGRCVCANEAQ